MVALQSGAAFPLPSSSSLLFEPTSSSLALYHSDSSFSLYPSLSLSSTSPPLPPPQTLTHSSSAAAFLLLHNPSRVIFITSGPHLSQILLRFYTLNPNRTRFSPSTRVVCKQKGLTFDPKLGLLMDLSHGFSVRLCGSVNYFAVCSVSASKIWVFGVRECEDGGLKVMRCAVIDCCRVVWSLSVEFGWLVLGEEGGVRVFDLRRVTKGTRVRKNGKVECGGDCLCRKNEKSCVCVKQRSVKLKQDSCEDGMIFVAFKGKELETSKSRRRISVKAISVDALSPNKFLILDSDGGLQLLHLSNPVSGLDIITFMQQLPYTMKVQKVAVLSELSARTQSVWVSDGYNSVQMMVASDMDSEVSENDINESKEKPMHITVGLTIFTGEKIQDLAPLAANAILILGQGNLYTFLSNVLFKESCSFLIYLQVDKTECCTLEGIMKPGPVWCLTEPTHCFPVIEGRVSAIKDLPLFCLTPRATAFCHM